MSRPERTALDFGRTVAGPIVAEFCLRLWGLSTLLEHPERSALLFCARGGLRMQTAFEHFLDASGFESPVRVAPLMVSRLVAIRPALAVALRAQSASFGPAAAAALEYEFARLPLRAAVRGLSGIDLPDTDTTWSDLTTPTALLRLLRAPEGADAAREILEQADRFEQHLRDTLGERTSVILVDTGLYGTTGLLMQEGFPDLDVATVLIARTYRPLRGARAIPTFGLSIDARGYSPFRRRTALLRYWHFVEWLFEPELASVRRFDETADGLRSNLETSGWRDQIAPRSDSVFTGALDYLDSLPRAPGDRILHDADLAWTAYRRAVVWPTPADASALEVGRRTHDFGREDSWGSRAWRGPIAALRGSTMWREGEIARSGTSLAILLLVGIESAYAARWIVHTIKRR